MPPLVGVAVKVIDCPAHIGFVPAVMAMLTLGVTVGLTVVTIAFEVAGLAVTPGKLEVITHVTDCPFVKAVEVYVEEFVPILTPLTFH